MKPSSINILLADDDIDDCAFFKEALEELKLSTHLEIVNNGVNLMQLLQKRTLPDVLFLDLNMPLKDGFACLSEIKANKLLKPLPVIIISTSFEQDVAYLLYEKGAYFYMRKPASFSILKRLLFTALTLIINNGSSQPLQENFVLNSKII